MTKPRSNQPGDVVLIHFEGQPALFARIEDIRPQGKPRWFLCDLLVLMPPAQPLTWILRREQIDGEPFTMGGRPVEIHALPPLGAVHAAAARKLAEQQDLPTSPEAAAPESTAPVNESQDAVRDPGEVPASPPPTDAKDAKVIRLVPRDKRPGQQSR